MLDAKVEEAGIARIYAGLHFRFDIIAGQAIGAKVAALALTKVPGSTAAVSLQRMVWSDADAYFAAAALRVMRADNRAHGTPNTVTCVKLSTLRPSAVRWSHCSMYTAGCLSR